MLLKLQSLLRIAAMLESILIAFGCARSLSTAMHSTSFFVFDRRRQAGRAFSSLGTASQALAHRLGITFVSASHYVAYLNHLTPAVPPMERYREPYALVGSARASA